ncbi:MAG: response regulator [Prevotella sp.]|nr:response regulator [Prevotella sp.]
MRARLIICCLLLAVTCHTQAAQPIITAHHYTTDNGLPDNNVRCMVQDDDGFLWLGTLYGLYRFDGHSYRSFLRTSEGNNSLMRTNRVKEIKKLPGGLLRLRFNTDQMSCYDTKRDMFVEYKDSATFAAQEKKRIKNRFTDNLGNAIVYDNAGSIEYTDRNTGRKHRLRVISDRLLKATTDYKVNVVTDKEGMIWVSTNGDGLYLYDPKTEAMRHISAKERKDLIPSDRIVAMILDRNGDVWVSNVWYGLTRLHINHSRYEVIRVGEEQTSESEVRVLSRLPDGNLVAGKSRGALVRVSMKGGGGVTPYDNMPADVIYNSVGYLPDGSLWATTTNSGLYLKDRFYLGKERTDRVLTDNKGRLWVGSINGLFAMTKPYPEGNESFRRFFTDIANFEVRCIRQDAEGRLWLGTSIGVVTFLPDQLIKNPKAYEVYPLKTEASERVRVTSIYEDNSHRIWVGTSMDGLWRSYRKKDGKLGFESLAGKIVTNDNIQNITPDGKGNIWISTEEGYACYDLKANRTKTFMVEGNRLLNYCNANCAVALGDGKMAFGTLDGILITDASGLAERKIPHKVMITGMLVNGQNIEQMQDNSPLKEASLSNVGEIRLTHDQNYLTIRFSDLMYEQSENTRYTYWLEGNGGETEWNAPAAASSVNYQNLSPGRYVFHVAEVVNGERVAENELVIVIGEPWWNTWWAYLIYLCMAAVTGYVLFMNARDKLRLRQRIHDEKMLSEFKMKFFTNVSHEFRTPLTLIMSSIDKLQANASGMSSSQASTVSLLKNSTERMKRLIDQLLEFRNMETGKLSLRVQETDACVFIYNIWQQFHDISDRRSINYTFQQAEKSIPCYMDQGKVDKIMFNLISNAFKYTPVKGSIEVTVGTAGEEGSRSVVVSVADNGVGVPEEKRATLFEQESSSNIAGDSMGIGLNLVAALVKVHHGTINYTPPTEGSGSVFTLTLPMEKQAYKADEFISEEAQLLSDGDGKANEERAGYTERYVAQTSAEPMNDKTVLIAEDDLDILEVLKAELSQYFTVVTAHDGQEAIDMLEGKVPDLLITDYLMPNKSGFEVLQHVRKSAYRYLPVIMLTAVDSDLNKLKGTKLGADAYVTKPFSMPLLIAQCVQLIKTRSYMMLDFGKAEAATDDAVGKKVTEIQLRNQMKLPEVITEERDRRLVAQLDSYIETHIGDSDLNVDKIAEALGYRRTNFYNKISTLLGCSPKEYVRKHRIMRAADMLQDEKYTIAEVAYKLGFSSPQYMSSVFKAYYGMSPSEYQKGVSAEEKKEP